MASAGGEGLVAVVGMGVTVLRPQSDRWQCGRGGSVGLVAGGDGGVGVLPVGRVAGGIPEVVVTAVMAGMQGLLVGCRVGWRRWGQLGGYL